MSPRNIQKLHPRDGRSEFARTRYGSVAKWYERLVWLSGPGIDRSRRAFLGSLPFVPERPLIVGCGSGKFAADFARSEMPRRLTLIDLSLEMLVEAERRVRQTGWPGELHVILGDASELSSRGSYDLIAVQFVLTCFDQDRRVAFLKRLRRLMAPSGAMVISDYSRPEKRWREPWFQLNYWAAESLMWPLAGNPPHAPGDVEQALLDCGLNIERKKSFMGGIYSAWLVRRPI